MNYSGHTATRLRSIGRRMGFLPPLVRAWRKISGSGYEQRFDAALLGAIGPGDTVWDIGANVGHYTAKFLDRVGAQGRVVAFEPSEQNQRVLSERVHDPRLTLAAVALAERPGITTFYRNPGDHGTTDSMTARSAESIATQVQVCRGDDFLAAHAPQVVKIDVEGFELEVLRGMSATLLHPGLRALFVEVHFGILNDRGLPDAPAEIVQLLEQADFQLRWIDPSHLQALRRDGA